MRYSPINEHAWRWKSELGNTEWHEPKPKLNYNSNGCSVPRHLMGNHFRPRLPLLRPMVRAGARETESSEPLSATRWGKAQSPRRLASVLDQARCWIWTPTVSHNQQWFMCNARSRGAHKKDHIACPSHEKLRGRSTHTGPRWAQGEAGWEVVSGAKT